MCLTTDLWGCTGCVGHGMVHHISTGQEVTGLSTALILPIAPAILGVFSLPMAQTQLHLQMVMMYSVLSEDQELLSSLR